MSLYRFRHRVKSMPMEQIDSFLSDYPESKKVLAGLILMVENDLKGKGNPDDWECDFSEVVWAEVKSLTVTERRKSHEC